MNLFKIINTFEIGPLGSPPFDDSEEGSPESSGNPFRIHTERISVGTTIVQATAQDIIGGVWIKADDDNTERVFVGTSGETTDTGFRLNAGQAIHLDVANANEVHVIASTASQVVFIMGVKK